MQFLRLLSVFCLSIFLLFPAYADYKKSKPANTPDFSKYRDVKQKKAAFFNFMRDIINAENKLLLTRREKIKTLLNKTSLSSSEQEWLKKMAKKYNVKMNKIENQLTLKKLLPRVDIVPLELALAQAANESSWGTSRFAVKGRNFFGQWCFKKGCGLIPSRRDKGARHEVAVFKTVNDSVAAYIHNLNTGRVYAGLRKIRQQLRASNKQPDALAMAGGLKKYSSRGMAYVKEIRAMIRYNRKLMLGS